MSANHPDLDGPDLTLGIPLSDLADNQVLVGHVGDEAVLLARRGEELFAIGATCTHYSGPLGEGLMVGDTVRCPWHHACFSLRTGEAVRAPALHPVSCWRVERRGSSVYVTEPRDPDRVEGGPTQLAATSAPGAKPVTPTHDGLSSVVIVGAGAAGDAAADMLRREGFEGRLTVIDSGGANPYDRPNLSKDYLAGTAPEEWLPLRSPSFYEERRIDLVLSSTATAIDPKEKRVFLDSGKEFNYDALLLATGANPSRLNIPGAQDDHVHYLRTLTDSRAILDAAAERAVVIGAGFIGMEVAASLRARGLEVHVVAPEELPLERIMGAELGRFIRDLHESNGVAFHLNQTVMSVDPHSVTLSSGDIVPADLVVVGIGVRPRVSVAEHAGLDVDDGVIVDEYCRTSIPDIFAAGDVARWPYRGSSVRVEHWVVAQRQGQAAARNMLGRREPFDAVPFFWSQHYDVTIAYVGHAHSWNRVDIAGSIDDRDCAIAFRKDNATLAVVTINRDQDSLKAEWAMEQFDEAALEDIVPRSVV